MDQNKYIHVYITIIFKRNVRLGKNIAKQKKIIVIISTARIENITSTMFDDSFFWKNHNKCTLKHTLIFSEKKYNCIEQIKYC